MLFNSIHFGLFFPLVVLVYFIIPNKLRTYWLLIASYYFYMSWNAKYVILIGFSTIATYISGLLLSYFSKTNDLFKKKAVLVLCIVINLCLLGLFKYCNFFIELINPLLNLFHISIINRRFDFLLPVGISFYTFQALGYIIDVYREDVEVEKNFFKYALFVSFFPQLVAGPIERSKTLIGQLRKIEEIKVWNPRRITSGSILIIWGLFMKMVIADRISILVDTVFDNYQTYGGTELVIAAIAFSIQIYCDFCSYSTIAMGTSKVLGIELMNNFNAPYFAQSISDFWDRWHISLSTWFRDYLYIPLGGNRKGIIRKQLNTMAVFLLSGLWHGANLSFILWGGIHGFYHVIGEFLKPLRQKLIVKSHIKTNCFSWHLLKIVFTFAMVSFAWIFFRSNSVSDAFQYIHRLICNPSPWFFFDGGFYSLGLNRQEMNILIISLALLFSIDLVRVKKNITIDTFLFTQNIWFEWAFIILLILMILTFGSYGPAYNAKQFIYFQF